MPTTVPTPFGELDLPPRTSEQKDKDRVRKEAQTDLLMLATSDEGRDQARAASSSTPDALYQTLLGRRVDAASSVVRFEATPTDTGQWSLVVPGQILVRHGVGGTLSPDVDPILAGNKFSPRPGAVETLCPELAGRITAYEYDDGATADDHTRIDDMRRAVDEVRAVAQAAPTLVTALQQATDQPPPQKVVAKAAVGPSPTEVDASDQAFKEAGLHAPQGSVVVAVVDTGIADVHREDGWLGDVDRAPGTTDPLDAVPHPNQLLDFAAGHGTFAAGIVRMIDPEAQIAVYTALDSDGFANESTVACAMIKAFVDGAQVINLSNGMHTVDNTPSVAFEAALERIDELARELGREPPAIVASAGNYGDTQPVWPAAFTDRVISVAALTADLEPAEWSSHGDWVTCSCVGEGIVSTFVPGTEDSAFTNPVPGLPGPDTYPLPGQQDAWAVWSGTSFAAPQIAGAIARTMREAVDGPIAPRAASWRLIAQGTSIPGYGKALRLLSGT